MKAQSIQTPILGTAGRRAKTGISTFQAARSIAWALGLAGIIAALLVLAAWAATHGYADAMAAIGWMTGILFAALAVDSRGTRAGLQLGTAIILMMLAWLCSRAAPEFGILAAVAVAIWITDAALKWKFGAH